MPDPQNSERVIQAGRKAVPQDGEIGLAPVKAVLEGTDDQLDRPVLRHLQFHAKGKVRRPVQRGGLPVVGDGADAQAGFRKDRKGFRRPEDIIHVRSDAEMVLHGSFPGIPVLTEIQQDPYEEIVDGITDIRTDGEGRQFFPGIVAEGNVAAQRNLCTGGEGEKQDQSVSSNIFFIPYLPENHCKNRLFSAGLRIFFYL